MKGFARVTKLTDIGGRADYISNPKRQEKIVAKSAPVDWQPYSRFEQENQRTASKNNEGREIVITVPNAWNWMKLTPWELNRRCQDIAVTAVGKSTDMQWALHWNKARTNLHLHVIFSERQKEQQIGVWDRDIYHTAEGKVARTKADRARDPDGNILPPVHRKGEPKGGFTAKAPKYKTQNWVWEMKKTVKQRMTEKWGVKFDAPSLLHEYHEGKGKDAPKIREKNERIRTTNRYYEAFIEKSPKQPSPELVKQLQREALSAVRAGRIAVLTWGYGQYGGDEIQIRRYTEAELKKNPPKTAPLSPDEKKRIDKLKAEAAKESAKESKKAAKLERRQRRKKRPQKPQEPPREFTPLPPLVRPPQSRPEPEQAAKQAQQRNAGKGDRDMASYMGEIRQRKAAAIENESPRHGRRNARATSNPPKNGGNSRG